MKKNWFTTCGITSMILMLAALSASGDQISNSGDPTVCRRPRFGLRSAFCNPLIDVVTDDAKTGQPAGKDHKEMKTGKKLSKELASFRPEFYPRKLQSKLDLRDHRLAHSLAAGTKSGVNPQKFFIQMSRRWEIGSTVTVALRGADDGLYAKIEQAANEWTKHANLKFNFRDGANKFRIWSPDDATYRGMIRISFNDPQGGAWSLIGKDSADPDIVGPGEASMNFQDFHIQLPDDYAATVMHEFGHAIGFHHEHQSPLSGCDIEFDWNAIYDFLLSQGWSKAEVDFNMKQMPNSNAFEVGPYDRLSIMHYHFPASFFLKGADSPCYVPRNVILSSGDTAGTRKAYPSANADIIAVRALHIRNLEAILESPHLEPKTKKRFELHLQDLKK